MKKRISLLVSTLALVALASFAQAAPGTKFAVQGPDGAQTPADQFAVTDTGWVGIGAAAAAPAGPLHIIGSGSLLRNGGVTLQYTSTGAAPGFHIGPNFSLYRNLDPTVNGGLPRIDDSLGAFNFGAVIGGTALTNRGVIYVRAEKAWTATDNPSYIQLLTNQGAGLANRESVRFSGNGTMTVNGGVRIYPYTGTGAGAIGTGTNPPVKPACSASTQGTLWFTKTAGADTLQVCADGATGIQWRTISLP